MASSQGISRAPVKALVLSILRLFGASAGLFALALAGITYMVGFNLFLPLITRHVFDRIIPDRDGHGLVIVAIALVSARVVRVFAAITQETCMAKVTSRAMAIRRARMFEALQAKPAAYYNSTPAAETLGRFSSDLAVLETATTRLVPRLIYSSFNICACTALMLILDIRLAAVIAVLLLVAFAGPRKRGARAAAANAKRRDAEGKLLATVQESIALHSVIRTFAVEKWVRSSFDTKLDDFRDSATRATAAGSSVESFTVLAFSAVQVLVLCGGAYLVIAGNLSAGQLIAFTSLVGTVSGSMFGLSSMLPPLIESSSGFDRVQALFDSAGTPGSMALPPLRGEVKLDHVNFSYTGERQDLRDVTIEIQPATSAAFVGPSGSGKSTALTLSTRSYTPLGGRVLIDGHDLADASSTSLYAQMAIVAQESLLFNTTVRENIRVGRLDATDEEVEAAARKAEIHDAILAMSRGYNTPVGERGGNLSGGQRQRIALARAILRDPKLLVLDEATSALDPATEEAVSKTLDKLATGRTIVSVTHRLSTVKGFHRIFVMKDGQVIESGSHAELGARGGLYQELWTKQNGVSVSASGKASIAPDLLGPMPLLSSLDEPARRDLAGKFVTLTFNANHELFRVGDPGEAIYVVARGQVSIDVPGGGEPIVLSDGGGFGEIALLSSAPRTATARTRTPCALLVLPRVAVVPLLEQ